MVQEISILWASLWRLMEVESIEDSIPIQQPKAGVVPQCSSLEDNGCALWCAVAQLHYPFGLD